LTSTCPYGLGACWGGAYEALTGLAGVAYVHKVPSAEHSTAQLLLRSKDLAEIERWPEQFAESANGSYAFRGVEATLLGTAVHSQDGIEMTTATDPPISVRIVPFEPNDKVQWDPVARRPKEPTPGEIVAYRLLDERLSAPSGQLARCQVTGPLKRSGGAWELQLRRLEYPRSQPSR
jgi:galactose oxidase